MYRFLNKYFHGDSTARSVTLFIGGLVLAKTALSAGRTIGYGLTK